MEERTSVPRFFKRMGRSLKVGGLAFSAAKPVSVNFATCGSRLWHWCMEMNKTSDKKEMSPTEFGTLLRVKRVLRGTRRAKDMADAMGISSGRLSNIENGKAKSMDIDFLLRCRDFFGLKEIKKDNIKETLEIFYKGFVSAPENISLDMKYFSGKRKILLAKILVALLFMPDELAENQEILVCKDHYKDVADYKSAMVKVSMMASQVVAACSIINGSNLIKDWDSPVPSKKST